MTTTKKKSEGLDLAIIGTDLSLERLTEIFQAFASGVQHQLEAATDEEHAEAKANSAAALQVVLGEEVARRDQLVQLHSALLERAARIRKTVQNAEKLARHYEAFSRGIESSVELFMVEQSVTEINGELHRFKLYKAADQLQITDPNLVPEAYRKFSNEQRFRQLAIAARDALLTMLKCMPTEFGEDPMRHPVIAAIEKAIGEIPSDTGTPDKDQIIAALTADKEVPGCFILKNRKRLDIK